MTLLFLFSSISFAEVYSWSTGAASFPTPELACRDRATTIGVIYTHHVMRNELSADCYDNRVGFNSTGTAIRSGDSCADGATFNTQTGECVIDQLCENRPPIISDTGTDPFSYQGCNYKKCGTIMDFDNGHYNLQMCPDSGYCADSLLGCSPENTSPHTQDLPNGCGSFGGKTVCIDQEDPQNCYVVDGVQQCYEKNAVCGVKNGVMQCIQQDETNCGKFNGETVCVLPDQNDNPTVVDPDSPDHPNNGGNLDGDNTNDVTDSRSVATGGDPTRQPTDDKITALDEKKAGLNAEYNVNEMLKRNLWEKLPTGTAIQDSVKNSSDQTADDLLDQSQNIIDGVVSGNQFATQENTLHSTKSTLLGALSVGSSCTSLPIVIPSRGTYYVDCYYLDKTREFLSFLFYIVTVFSLFAILTRPMEIK